MIRCCNARRRGDKPALKDKLRCRLHGGRAGRPPGIPLPAHENAALPGRLPGFRGASRRRDRRDGTRPLPAPSGLLRRGSRSGDQSCRTSRLHGQARLPHGVEADLVGIHLIAAHRENSISMSSSYSSTSVGESGGS